MIERLELELLDDGPAWGLSHATGQLRTTSHTVRIVAHISDDRGSHEVRHLGTFLRPEELPLPSSREPKCATPEECHPLFATHLSRVRESLLNQGWCETASGTCCRDRPKFERTIPDPE